MPLMGIRLERQNELDEGIGAKLEGAEAHLDDLRQSIDSWREGDHYRFGRESNPEGEGRWVTRWSVLQLHPFPPEWAVWAGEILYQLHSSLDHLAWELANTKAMGEEPDRVTFPIYASRSKFWRRDKGGSWRMGSGGWVLQRIIGPARPLILDLQPYQRGNDAPAHRLWQLYTLSNQDKHKSLHVASSALKKQRYKGLEMEDLEHLGSGIENDKPFEKHGRDIFWSRFREIGPKPKLKAKADFSLEPVFGYGSPDCVVGESLFETLRAIYNFVVREVFQRRFNPLLA